MFVEKRESRSGLPVPVIIGDAGEIFLSSSYDPQKEAEKLIPFLKNDDLVFFIGGPPDYLPTLAATEKRRVFVLAFPEEMPLYENRSVSGPKNTPTILEITDGWEDEVSRRLFPFCSRSYRIIPNRGWEAAAPERMRDIKSRLNGVLERMISDAAIFKRFGRLWHKHFMKNKLLPNRFLPEFTPIETVYIVGAAPSSEEALFLLKNRPAESVIVAVDTAYSFLIENEIEPEYVVTIDAQLWSLYHFIGKISQKTALVSDLTSLPQIAQRFQRVVWCAGTHPLCQTAALFLNLPPLNTAGGNVATAALSFARLFHPKTINAVGVDFSYPRGKCYCRGSWLPQRWLNRCDRLNTIDSENEELLQSRPYRFDADNSVYQPLLFERYRNAWKTEADSPQPSFSPITEDFVLFSRRLENLPDECTAPLRCAEFYKNNS